MNKKNNIKVSIVIPVYNSEKTIGKCLDSLVNQTYENIEIICVNDCSKDSLLSVLEQYAAKDNRIVVINHAENKNAGGARNSGIKAASGDYICFVDNDDWLCLDAIEILVKASENGSYDVVAPQWSMAYADGSVEQQSNFIVGGENEAIKKHCLLEGGRILGVLFSRRMVVDNEIFYPENLFWEDNAIGACFILCAQNINVIADNLYFYSVANDASSSRSISYKRVADRLVSNELLVENIDKRGLYDKYKEETNFRFLSLCTYSIMLLAEIPYKLALPLIHDIESAISKRLPNKYFDNLNKEEQWMLLNPLAYVKRENNKRRKVKIKSFFHSIRHGIVVVVKRILGINPKNQYITRKSES